MNIEQAKDLGLIWLVRATRFTFGWYWNPEQRAQLDEAEDLAREACALHAGEDD